uniref:Non-specific serine/threonine protein kinase n=2 Tax=Strongyloides stercoralis TaxID=6248 RepID=A0A0K0EG78_STRER
MNSPFRGLRRSGNQSYPYPRTHTPVMVFRNNLRSVVIENSPESSPNLTSRITVMSAEDIKKNYVPKRRPPLNWAIPTIPESLSDESLKSLLSQRNDEMGNLIIENKVKKIDASKLDENMTINKDIINKETTDALTNCILNEYDKKNNNFVDKFKIKKYWKKHQKNKSFEEKDVQDKRNTQIPRLKMKNILKISNKEKDNLDDSNITMDSNEKYNSQKLFPPKINTIYSNSILGKSPLITMAQRFRNRNRKYKDPTKNSSTNVNGSTSMDFMKTMFLSNVNQYTESLRRSQSLEAKTDNSKQLQKSDTLETVDETPIDENYHYIYTSIEKEESKQRDLQNAQDNNLSLIKDNLPLKINTSSANNNNEVILEDTSKNNNKNEDEIKCEKVNSISKENLNNLENDNQISTNKQANRLSFKSLFNNKKIKNEKTKNLNKEICKENNSSDNKIINGWNKMASCAELESKLFLENPLNRPLVVPKNFGKCNNDEYDPTPKDDNLLSCIETYAPLYFRIKKNIAEEGENNDDLCPLRIPKNNVNIEKLPLKLKELYCKPLMLEKNELPENIKKCKEIEKNIIETIKETLQQQKLIEKNLQNKEEKLEKAITLMEGNLTNFDFEKDECVKEAIKYIMSLNIDEKIDLESLSNSSPCKTNSDKNDDDDIINGKNLVKNKITTSLSNGSNEDISNNLKIDCNSIDSTKNSDCKLTNDAIYFASVNSLSSGTSDIVIETSSEECDNLQHFSPLNLNNLPSPITSNYEIKEDKNQLSENTMITEATVIDNILPPKFIKSTYIPMIEDSIGSDSDIIGDKICKSGDGFKLDISFSSNILNNNDIHKKKEKSVDASKQLVNLSPYESVPIDNIHYEKNILKPLKLKNNTSRKPGKQFFSFFLKNKKKHESMKKILNEDKIKKAPLAQSECTRIANSPMVETPPISLFQKNCKTITDYVISSVPAVVKEEEYLTPKTPRSRGNIESSAGLIDDELNDQPMLIGNSYSMNNLGSLTSFQIDNFDEEEEYKSDLMNTSINSASNKINNNELFVINNKGMAKSITDALIANNLKNETSPNNIVSNNNNNQINSDKITFPSIVDSFNITDDEKSDKSYNSAKENQIVNNANEEHILKCTENGESRIDIKLVEFKNQPTDFCFNTYQENYNYFNKPSETTNLHSIIKQLKQENKKLQEIIEIKDDEIKLLKEKLSIFIDL